jgi:hypothetical protein
VSESHTFKNGFRFNLNVNVFASDVDNFQITIFCAHKLHDQSEL